MDNHTAILGWGPNSARTFTSNKPLTSVDDFNGQVFRVPNNPIHKGIVEELGASYTTMGLDKLYNALETGAVDGQDNGMVTVISENLNEVQKYIYETNHIIATLEVIINTEFLLKLTPEQQQIVREAASLTAKRAWDDYIASIDKDRESLVVGGTVITACSAEDQALILNRIQPLMNTLYAENNWAEDLVSKIKEIK